MWNLLRKGTDDWFHLDLHRSIINQSMSGPVVVGCKRRPSKLEVTQCDTVIILSLVFFSLKKNYHLSIYLSISLSISSIYLSLYLIYISIYLSWLCRYNLCSLKLDRIDTDLSKNLVWNKDQEDREVSVTTLSLFIKLWCLLILSSQWHWNSHSLLCR
jgi:hypothetical protein